ncbi:MAG: hypothetical protein JSV03_07530, partial [Planctomycetota bacterium]
MSGREYTSSFGVCASLILAVVLAQPAMADVGEIRGALPGGPWGSFSIKITHGATTLIDKPSVPLPNNIKFNDGSAND